MTILERLDLHLERGESLPAPLNLSRRRFMQGVGGLALGVYLGVADAASKPAAAAANWQPNAFVRIDRDSRVTIIAKHLEMGQGTYTGLATLLAEELDADWNQIQVEGAPADASRYGNTLLGNIQGTGGSNAIANSYEQMRRAGASARAMLVAAAAARWKVDAATIRVDNGVVLHAASGRKASFGELTDAAAKQRVPQTVKLKDPQQFRLIGRQQLPRKDNTDKTDGSARFTQDVQLPGLLVAVVAHPPRFGATLKAFDASKAKAMAGVVDVVSIKGAPGGRDGVAVLAKNTWIAKQARDALSIEWDDSKAVRLGSSEILQQYRGLLAKPGAVAHQSGDVDAALKNAEQTIDAEYEFPYLAHAAMEPLNCVAQFSGDACEVWNGEQFQTIDVAAIAGHFKLAPQRITIHQLYAGGSFGRRANPHGDYVVEAVAIAKAAYERGHKLPVKMVWTREDDMRAGYFRPLFVHRVQAVAGKDASIRAWQHRIVGQSIMSGTPFAGLMKNGIDEASVEGAAGRYTIANTRIELHTPQTGVPVQWWRSVGHTHTAFVTETMIDQLAKAAKQDPVAFRRALLRPQARHLAALELAVAKSGWSTPLPAGGKNEKRGRGIAVHESFNTVVAQVAEVTVKADGSFSVDRVVCAVHCGLAVNPDVVRAQMEGGIGFGLSAALHGAITLQQGAVQETNFHQYPVLRINEMPTVEVHIVPSADAPTGVGEPGVPPIAPAVANALFAATGKTIRKLPFANALRT